jgi:SagB-type dehydrogenase family enzyme
VTANSGFLSWEEQPSAFKHYPEFLPRIPCDDRLMMQALRTARTVTDTRDFDGTPYHRLSTPSAGNLHPLELYVQIRGVEGTVSGIYHLDALHDALVRIEEVGAGFEPMMGYANRFEGMLILLSIVPYRSEWKYGHRAWRYCFMDAGHQAGALMAAFHAVGLTLSVVPAFDKEALNRFMGFEDQEYACLAFAMGQESSRRARSAVKPLMRVMPTDYNRSDGVVGDWLSQLDALQIADPLPVSDAPMAVQLARRSARSFSGAAMSDAGFEHIMHLLSQPPEGMTAYAVVMDPERENGLWRNGEPVKAGAFGERLAALLVGQRFIMDGGIVMILTTPDYGPGPQLLSALFGHRAALDAATRDVGFTAIGAFYDNEVKRFLETDDAILYVGVFGMEESENGAG